MGLKRHFPAGLASVLLLAAGILGCSGSSSGGSVPAAPATGTLALSVSDAATEDWAVVGVKLASVALRPAGGGAPVTVLAAPAELPVLNLVQLDSLSDLLAHAQVPVGSYDQAILTFAANPGDVTLTAAASPSAAFTGIAAGATVKAADIQVRNTTGSAGNLTTSATVKLAQPLVVAEGQRSNLDLEFLLDHPAFIVDHTPAAGSATLWTVNFSGSLRHRPVPAPEQVVLRHLFGQVTGVAAGGASLTAVRNFPRLPATSPEQPVATPQVVQLTADPAHPFTFFDQDSGTHRSLADFSSLALAGRYIRAVTRFSSNDGSLQVVRLWAGSTFNSVWFSPEGHVDQVTLGRAGTPYQFTVETGDGSPVPVVVTSETQFFFRTPADAQADATPMATGTGFLDQHLLARGFKVHVSVTDFQASPLLAEAVDIEAAAYSGAISLASGTGFSYTHAFAWAADDYTVALGYLPDGTPNGTDGQGNPVTGFKWWNLTQADQPATGAGAAASFAGTVGGSIDFGGVVGPVKVWGASAAVPSGTGLASTWNARWVVLAPVRLPLGQVVAPFSGTLASGGSFTMTVRGGNATPVPVDVPSAAQVYQIDLASGAYSLASVDLASAAGLKVLTDNLGARAPVVVFAVPQASGRLLAYALYITATSAL